MKNEITEIRLSEEKSQANNGFVYYVTHASGATIRMELAQDMAEHLSYHSGVAITAR